MRCRALVERREGSPPRAKQSPAGALFALLTVSTEPPCSSPPGHWNIKKQLLQMQPERGALVERREGSPLRAKQSPTGALFAVFPPPLYSTPTTGQKPPALRLGKTLTRPRLLPRYCFLYGDTRELNKAPPGLCLRCFHRRSVRPPPPAKNPQPCGWGFLCRWWGSNPHGITTNGF